MLNISFTDNELNELNAICRQHPDPVLRRRALILVLKSHDIAHHKIAAIADVCENTVRAWLKVYENGGVAKLKVTNFHKPKSRLSDFETQIKKYFDETPPATIKQACAEIEKLTGVSVKNTQMRAYLKSIGIKHRKVNSIPAKANIEAQKSFHDEELQPRLQEAKSGKRAVYFVDASHFVLGAFLGYLWSFVRVFVKTPSGRKRYNVLGALNAISKELITVSNDSYITSLQVCQLLRTIAKQTSIPITLVLDNASYQRCKLVTKLAEQLDIELLFLPPYSPNLNLIERLWKLVKKECLYSKYYEDFELFSQAIETFLNTMNETHKEKLNTLLTLNFQTFSQEQFARAA